MSLPLCVGAARAANVELVVSSTYTRCCERGGLSRAGAARLLAFQSEASRGFLPFLSALADRMAPGAVRDALLCNLAEETEALPSAHAQWAVRTRSLLLGRLGVTEQEQACAEADAAPHVGRYLSELDGLLSPRIAPLEAAAAFALAVEDVVPAIYRALIKGLAVFPGVAQSDLSFFEAHVACDVDHALRILLACFDESRVVEAKLRWQSALDCASSLLTTRVRALDDLISLPDTFHGAPHDRFAGRAAPLHLG